MENKEIAGKIVDLLVESEEIFIGENVTHRSRMQARRLIRGLENFEIGQVLVDLHSMLFDYYYKKNQEIRESKRLATFKISDLFEWNESYMSRLKKLSGTSDYIKENIKKGVISEGGADVLVTKLKKYPGLTADYVIESILKEVKFKCPEYKINARLIKKWFDIHDYENNQELVILNAMEDIKKKLYRVNFSRLSERQKKEIITAYFDLITTTK